MRRFAAVLGLLVFGFAGRAFAIGGLADVHQLHACFS